MLHLGRHWPYLAKLGSIASDKHASLFFRNVSDEEEFYTTET